MKGFFRKVLKHPFVTHLVLMGVVLSFIIFGLLFWLAYYTHHNEAVVVPNVKGLSMDDAVGFFERNGLRYSLIDSVSSKDVQPGAIVEIVPNAGSKVKEGRIIFVTINATNARMGEIPEVADLSFRQAQALLRNLGFTSLETKYVAGEYRDLSIGIEWNERLLNSGDKVPLGAWLQLLVSDGMGMDSTEMDVDSMAIDSSLMNNEEEKWF